MSDATQTHDQPQSETTIEAATLGSLTTEDEALAGMRYLAEKFQMDWGVVLVSDVREAVGRAFDTEGFGEVSDQLIDEGVAKVLSAPEWGSLHVAEGEGSPLQIRDDLAQSAVSAVVIERYAWVAEGALCRYCKR